MVNNQSVRRHLDAFTRGRIIGKLEEGRSVTSVAAEFGIAHSIVSRLWRQFQPEEQLSGGSVVVVHEEPHPQMTGTLSYRPEETGGRQREKSLDTRHRRLDDRYRVLPWPEDCTVVVCLHDALYGGTFNACPSEKAFSVVPGTPELRDNEWGRVLFTEESRFSLSSDSLRILIWRERESRNHPSNSIERNRDGGRDVLVWGGIMLGSRTETFTSSTQVQSTGPVIVTRFFFHLCVFLEALWTLGSSYLTTSNDSGASIGAARRMDSNASTTH
ncbi:transposable element Tcb1 transposase [Trichonephila clavipes]|nr:transposable element Tcb1 transposase [Trichonephila clavipes]